MNTLEFNDINYKVRTGKGKKAVTRHILKNVNGNFVGGELVAIIGSSGAGKTTLLNILAGRVTGGIVTGEILFNGSRRVESQFKKMIAYVEQDDLLYPTLTVYETLLYAAKLRVDNKRFNLSDKKERVENVIRQLRLTNSRNTLIGNEKIRGVSGGERKRVSIGVEIITDPLMLMLDEPTSGLDSNSAENVIKLIKEFTIEKNVITVCSIHQPNSTIYSLFDKLVLLAPGGVVYMGSRADSLDYFSSIGYDCPTQENPADFFINLMTLDTLSEESLEESTKRVEHIKNSWAEKMARESSDTKEEENIQASRDQTNRSSVLSRGGALCRRVSRAIYIVTEIMVKASARKTSAILSSFELHYNNAASWIYVFQSWKWISKGPEQNWRSYIRTISYDKRKSEWCVSGLNIYAFGYLNKASNCNRTKFHYAQWHLSFG
ncbi:ABC transporter G family member 22 [Zancudomyces culisetae]|uniref:ABC transporter G family member 22 n=1 Tax=Zancudomyces culisetae TaxID=1213189 RepID=A0A1R1PLI3_ZANCU|nr:ABC transporter G family member 22 [Zancudomyces culisetae]|eukprot:OMH81793.1 ABC transporter G family member 22 [Zancudomyces culisetae]